eukprot:scaffold50064_cov298-Isochrysis_galbana.AAC.1
MCWCRCVARLCTPRPVLNPRVPTRRDPAREPHPSDPTRAHLGGGRQRAQLQRQQLFWLGARRAARGRGHSQAVPIVRSRAG